MALSDVVENNNLKERFSIGNSAATKLAILKTLVAETTASGNHATPRELGAAAGYTPAAGKQLRVIGFDVTPKGGGDSVGLQTASTDVGFNSSSAPATPDFGASVQNVGAVANSTKVTFENSLIVPAGRYLYFTSGSIISILIFGYEEDIV